MERQQLLENLAQIMHEDTGKPLPVVRTALQTLTDQELQSAIDEHEQQEIAKQRTRSTVIVDAELKAQKYEVEERRLFAIAAEQLRIANNDANYRLVRESLIRIDGVGLSWRNIAEIQSLIEQGRLSFAPGTPADQQRWSEQDQIAVEQEVERLAEFIVDARVWKTYVGGREVFDTFGRSRELARLKRLPLAALQQKAQAIEHERRLRSMSTEELRAAARTETKSAGTEQFERELADRYEREIVQQRRPWLPKVWRNPDGSQVLLDAEFIRRADRETFKIMGQKWGWPQINARLHGIKKVGDYVLQGEV
jgi:hypothetical protein